MAGLLGDIFSTVDTTKRKLTDLLGNPVLSAQQIIGNMNDRARVLNQLTSAAAQERDIYGPKSQQLANMIADAYNPMGMMVYHGSPAKFSRFDPTKIGSGEGAQAYGYGHYVAQNPAVARGYQESLSGGAMKMLRSTFSDDPELWVAGQIYSKISKPDIKEGLQLLGYKGNTDELIKSAENRMKNELHAGSFYEIDLPDEQIAKMLDWDKPLKNQPEALKAIRNQIQDAEIERSFDANVKSGISGANAMQNYVWGKTPADRSEALRNAGIPGIRYLDQSSRGVNQTWVVNNPKFGSYDFPSLEEAQAFIKSNPQDKLELIEPQKTTSNFVVFPGNEDLLTILRRNGGLLGP